MDYSEGQAELLNYLLEKLNFDRIEFLENRERFFPTNSNYTIKYFNFLLKSFVSFKNIGNCEKKLVIHNNKLENIPKDGLTNFKYLDKGSYFEIDKFSIFNFLQLEVDIKSKKRYLIKDNIRLDYITATDISNYTYCPVNYSISKTLHYKILESALIGTEKHEKSLISKMVKFELKEKTNNAEFEFQKAEIEDDENYIQLKKLFNDCEIVYSGHLPENKNTFFKSLKGRFIGQPDFILRNKTTKELIVIEEKYHLIPKEFYSYGNDAYYDNLQEVIQKKRESNFFYKNHLNQTASYLYGISDYNISYGILIYWKYEIVDGEKTTTKCFFTKVNRNDEIKFSINEIYKNILNFNRSKVLEFNINNLNPQKCASCVNNYLCGHKTGKFDKMSVPYNTDFIKIKSVPFPDTLKKDASEIDIRPSYVEKLLSNISHKDSDDFPF